MEELIRIKNLSKVYKMGNEKVVALKDINVTINKGEICCILGTSGSGKSTLLNMVAGLEKPTKGEIIIKGKHIEKMSEKQVTKFRQEHVGFVFQSYNLLPTLTAVENVAMPLIFGGVKTSKRNKLAAKVLESVGLGDRLKHKPSEMSGGQQQRVSIARAFVHTPEIVFADEPTGNLDTKTTMEIMDMISDIAKEHDQTLIIVTHDPETCVYADKIIHIRDGNIEKIEIKSREDDVSEKIS